jgi:uncharacterized FlgJ-related protein
MQFYRLDREKLIYKKSNTLFWSSSVLLASVLSTILLVLFILLSKHNMSEEDYISQESKAIIIRESQKENEFSEKNLKSLILEMNLKFPNIVLAQSKIESANFQSKLFKANNNLFGMRVAKKRPTTNSGENNGYAYYDSWKESVYDYGFYQVTQLSDIRTESEYLDYLSQYYAQDPNYLDKINKILESELKK